MSASVSPTSHADSRKGKAGLSCAECRRSVTYNRRLDLRPRLGLTYRILRSKLRCDRWALFNSNWGAVVEDESHLNLDKELSLVSPALEEVVPLYVQMVSVHF